MRLLFLTHRMPYPPDKGDKIRSFHLLGHLARRHEVHLATLVDDAADLRHLDFLRARVRSLVTARIDGALRRPLAASALLRGASASVAYFHSRSLQQQVDALLDAHDFDAVFCYSSPMAEYVFRSRHAAGRLAQVLKLMDFIDVDSAKWLDYAAHAPGWKAGLYRREARSLAALETRIAGEFDHLFLVSEAEIGLFPDRAARTRLQALPNGVDLEFYTPGTDAGDPVRLVFTGVMDYWPNVEGVSWFVAEVWPLIRAAFPEAQFDIVGSRPTAAVQALAHAPGVNVTGRVEDVRGFIARARVSVAPLRIARGVQNKVLEAMAMGRPVVTTPQAHAGLQADAGRELLVGADAPSFAAAVLRLLHDRGYADGMGRAARACVERAYRWDLNLAALDRVLP